MVIHMGEIKGFILSLITASAASALLEGMLPEDGELKKYWKFLLSLILLFLLLSPLKQLLGSIPNLWEDADDAYRSVEAMAHANSIIALHIERDISAKFDLDATVRYDGESIYVNAEKKLGIFASDLEKYIQQNYGVTAEVVLGDGE